MAKVVFSNDEVGEFLEDYYKLCKKAGMMVKFTYSEGFYVANLNKKHLEMQLRVMNGGEGDE